MERRGSKHYLPFGTAVRGRFSVSITLGDAGWRYASLSVLKLAPGEEMALATGDAEMLVLPLAGRCHVRCEELDVELDGRDSVFARVTDFAYLPRDASCVITSDHGGRFALPGAIATRRLPARYGAAADVPVEVRGAGTASRQVNNFASPEGFETDRLISVEVLTPGGNWSSYPPHKHDEVRPGEAVLEEIYYFEVDGGAADGMPGPGAYQRVYSSSPDRRINVLAEVSTGDVVLVPYGYHGPSMAAPGYDLYYLNVLAGDGPGRTMAFCDDPAHAWVRTSWDARQPDPRLPMTSYEGRQ